MSNKSSFWPILLLFLLSLAVACGPQEVATTTTQREMEVTARYLHFPVGSDNERRTVQILVDDAVYRYFHIEIAGSGATPLHWASVDVSEHKGKWIVLTLEPGAEELLNLIENDETLRRSANLYQEERRPQFHFSPQQGWTNDPNGLVWQDGEYHLFFQHNPYGVYWGNMTWGHAVSNDLMHWIEIGDALHPDELGTIYSGSAVVDHLNTSGFQEGGQPPIVTFYTSAGRHSYREQPFTQSMAYSTDRGRSWTKYEGNPILAHIEASNRDPKVFRHEESGRWVMVLYLDRGKFLLLGSRNLKDWEKLSDLAFPDGHECPELFELPVDGDDDNTRWVMWEGGGRHMIGHFDGQEFTPQTGVLPSEWGPNCYAGQTYNDVPDGRRIFIGWMRSGKAGYEQFYSGMPFNQQMTFPREFSLRTTDDGIRLSAQPVQEIAKLYANAYHAADFVLPPGQDALDQISGEFLDLELVFEAGDAKRIELNARGTPIVYETDTQTLSCQGKSLHIEPESDLVELRLLIDRTSIEIFVNDGRYVMTFNYRAKKSSKPFGLTAQGGTAKVRSLLVRELKSIWE